MNDSTFPRPEIEPRLFRRVMGRFATGVTVITAAEGEAAHGMTANAFMSGSLDPPLCVVSIAKRANMHRILAEAGQFAVNILAHEQERFASHFAGRPEPGLVPQFALLAGVPTLAGASARIVAGVSARHDCGDHTLVIGHIRHMESDERAPLLYHAGRFCSLVHLKGDEAVPVAEFW